MDLIGTLTSQLGIGKEQAEGAAGAIFGAIKSEAPAGDFQALTDKIPEAAGWMKAAAALGGGGGGGGGPDLGGMLGGALGGMLGGGGGGASPAAGGLLGSAMQALGGAGGAGGGLGALASLLPLLQNLKLDQNILGQLAPIVLNFIQQRMGAEAIGKLTQGSPLLGQLASMAGGGGGAGGLAGMVGKLF